MSGVDDVFDKELATDRMRMLLAGVDELTERKMFGSSAMFTCGNLICAAGGDSILVRVGAEGMSAALAEHDAEPMTMGERTMGGFVRVDYADLTDERLRFWVDVGLRIAAALPPK